MQLSTTATLLCRCRQLEQGTNEKWEGQSGSTAETVAAQELEGLHQELDELRHLHANAQNEVSLHTQSQPEGGCTACLQGLWQGGEPV